MIKEKDQFSAEFTFSLTTLVIALPYIMCIPTKTETNVYRNFLSDCG